MTHAIWVTPNTKPSSATPGEGPFAGPMEIILIRADTATRISTAKSIRHGTRPVVKVQIRSTEPTLRPTGRVAFYVRKKRVRTVSMPAKASGNLKVLLPKMKTSKHKIRAIYLPDGNHNKSTSATKTVRVRR